MALEHSDPSVSPTGVVAADAGADLILCAGTESEDSSHLHELAVLHALAGAINDGQLPRSNAHASVRRILAALKSEP
jgi:hypothetical protein